MDAPWVKKLIFAAGLALALWLGVRFVLPVATPFLLGGVLALAAEPAVALCRRWGLPRAAAAGVGVTGTLLLLSGLVTLVGAMAIRELTRLADAVPDLENAARQGLSALRGWCDALAHRAPEGVQPVLHRAVDGMFRNSGTLVRQVTDRIPGFLTAVLGGVPTGAVSVGTGLLTAFMVSARLPRLKDALRQKLPGSWQEKTMPLLRRVRSSLGGWLRAQGLLSAMIFAIVCVGLLLLKIPNAPIWAFLIAVMDAVPMLGTGIALIPWAAVRLLQGAHFQAIGLVCIFGAATLARTTLEPRLVGRQLGLDPLVTLAALYVGFRLWGFWGLLAAPVLTAAVKSVLDARAKESP